MLRPATAYSWTALVILASAGLLAAACGGVSESVQMASATESSQPSESGDSGQEFIQPSTINLSEVELASGSPDEEPRQAPAPKRPPMLPAANGVSVAEGLVFAGQPTEDELRLMQSAGYRVLDLRRPTEDRGFDQAALATEIGLRYQNIPVDRPALEDEAVHAAFRMAISADDSSPLLVHCASANRVAGLYYAMLVEDRGMSRDEALAQAGQLGLTSSGVKSAINAYLDR